MTISDLRAVIADMPAGDKFGITNELFAELFPPGKRDVNAMAHCYEFAKVVGCRIENNPEDNEIFFVKEDGRIQ